MALRCELVFENAMQKVSKSLVATASQGLAKAIVDPPKYTLY